MEVDQDNSQSSFIDTNQQQPVQNSANLTDEVSELFFGEKVEIKTYTDAATNETVVHKSNGRFFNQLLSLQDENEIYAAWEREHRDTLDDYEHTVGQPRVKADLTQWVNGLPPVLILQLNRTKFDKKTG